jgi:hypothetical protein
MGGFSLIRKAFHGYDHEHVNGNVGVFVVVDGFWRIRLRSGALEGPATVNPSALPEDT